MNLKPADKAKLAAAAGLLLILPVGGLLLYFMLSSSSQPEDTSTALPAGAPSAPAAAPSPDLHAFLRLVQADDTQQAAAMLAKDQSLASAKRAGDGQTALHLALSVPMAKLLLDNGADINATDARHSATPLRMAENRIWDVKHPPADLIKFLQSKSASEPDIFLATALGDIPQMEKLLAADPSLLNKSSAKDDILFDNCSPLQIAAYADQAAAAKFLLDHGADIHNRGGWQNTEAMEKAAWTGGTDVVQLLADSGGNVNGTDKNFTHSPLYNAALMGHVGIVKILLAHGAVTAPRLIPDTKTSMQHISTDGPPEGTGEDFQQILAMLGALPPTTAPTR